MFGKKSQSKPEKQGWVCCNLPTEIVSDYNPDNSGEVVHFYLIPLKEIFEHEGKEFYNPTSLIRFPQEDYSGDYPFKNLEMFSGGKCTLWKIGMKGDEEMKLAPHTVVFERNSSKDLKFSPAFFKILAHKKMAMVRVSAHKDWHWNHNAYDHYPNIVEVWKPVYAEQMVAEGVPEFTLLQPTTPANLSKSTV